MDADRLPEWFRLSLEIGSNGDTQPPLVAAVGWDLDMGHPRSERDIGDAVARVLHAANELHGAGLFVPLVLAEAMARSLGRETDDNERALLVAVEAYLDRNAEGK